MTKPYMADTNELLQNPQQVVAKPWRHGWRWTLQRLVFALIAIGLCATMLTGCRDFWSSTGDLLHIGGGDAVAQATRDLERVEVFVIDPSSFILRVDNDTDITPEHTVRDGRATEFTMRSTGTVVFNMPGGGDRTEPVEIGDTIILRLDGNTATVTLIRALPS
jgi:hypothetical protein